MASLNSVLYFMLYVVKRFVLSVPNLPIVLLTTRTADSLQPWPYRHELFSGQLCYELDMGMRLASCYFMVSNILTYRGSDYQRICSQILVFSFSFCYFLCQRGAGGGACFKFY
jgi:hypothetical protein